MNKAQANEALALLIVQRMNEWTSDEIKRFFGGTPPMLDRAANLLRAAGFWGASDTVVLVLGEVLRDEALEKKA